MLFFRRHDTKRIVRLLVLILLTCMFTTAPITADAAGFPDVKASDWFYGHLDTMIQKGIVNGMPDGTFRPSATVNTDQFIKMIVVAMGKTPSRLDAAYWAQPYIDAAKQNSYLSNIEFTDAQWKQPINRGDMARVLSRVLNAEGVDTPTNYYLLTSLIKDWSSIQSTKASAPVLHMYANGILNGMPDGSYRASRNMTRAEAIAVIHRLIDPAKRAPSDAVKAALVRDTVVVEGVEFSYQEDVNQTRLNRDMNVDVVVEFFKVSLDRMKFYKAADGKLHVSGNLPELPEGYQWHYGIDVYYKEPFASSFAGAEGYSTNQKVMSPLPLRGNFDKTLTVPNTSFIDYVEVQARVIHTLNMTHYTVCSLVTGTDIVVAYYLRSGGRNEIVYDWRKLFAW